MPNQFNTNLGYFQANLDSEFSHTISATEEWELISPDWTDQSIYQYNTELDRGTMRFLVKGTWRVDFVGTWQGATNDNMQLTIKGANQGTLYPPVKWNARGGNNWCISYAMLFKTSRPDNIEIYLKNEDDTAESTLTKGILTGIKLY